MKKFTAFLLALSVCFSAGAYAYPAAAENAGREITQTDIPAANTVRVTVCDAIESDSVPDWIPQSQEDIIELYNEHGSIYIKGDIVCFMRPIINDAAYDYKIDVSKNSDAELISKAVYSCSYSANDIFVDFNISEPFEIACFRMIPDGKLDFTAYNEDSHGTKRDVREYKFVSDWDGNITETDMYGWLPDSVSEYEKYIKKNGTVSVHDNYIVYCGDVNSSTGADLIFEQTGTAEVKMIIDDYVQKYDNSSFAVGNATHKVVVYKPVSEGTVQLSWTVARPWEIEESKTEEHIHYFAVDADKSVRETDESEYKSEIIPSEPVFGDVNCDNEFNIIDVMLLKKYLTGGDVAINPDAFNKQGTVDVLDLCAVKYHLMYDN